MIPTVTRYSPMKPSTSAQPALPLSTNPTPSTAVHQRSGFSLAERAIVLRRLTGYLDDWGSGTAKTKVGVQARGKDQVQKTIGQVRIDDILTKCKEQLRILGQVDNLERFEAQANSNEKRNGLFPRLKQASQAFLLENPYQPINLNRVESLNSYKSQLSSEIAPVIERLRALQQKNQSLNFKGEIDLLNRLQEYRSLDNPLITIYDRRKDEYRILVDVISRISQKIPK
jgi:hypothetical protein